MAAVGTHPQTPPPNATHVSSANPTRKVRQFFPMCKTEDYLACILLKAFLILGRVWRKKVHEKAEPGFWIDIGSVIQTSHGGKQRCNLYIDVQCLTRPMNLVFTVGTYQLQRI
ncbi:hypothetical protein V6N13_002101 [Hibiscus sabdariffa]|uniref:Uncharacterized protein n=1 Tax=Hibiscus sabdariffa TaxID=183260 RepID=A0ABR2C213_9ROSI